MKTIAFIPVRGGSKSIPLKNIKPFCGKPLVCWNIEALENCPLVDEVVVATDSDDIWQTVEKCNYQKTILILYSNFENNYPVAISVGKSYAEDLEDFNPSYTCENLESFVDTLKNILSSDDVMDVIKTLYSKANMLAND